MTVSGCRASYPSHLSACRLCIVLLALSMAAVCANGFGGDASGVCRPCPAGTFGQGLNRTQPCTPCSGNTVSTAPGASVCSACNEGVANADNTACIREC